MTARQLNIDIKNLYKRFQSARTQDTNKWTYKQWRDFEQEGKEFAEEF